MVRMRCFGRLWRVSLNRRVAMDFSRLGKLYDTLVLKLRIKLSVLDNVSIFNSPINLPCTFMNPLLSLLLTRVNSLN